MIGKEEDFLSKDAQYPKDKFLVFHKLFGGLHWRFFNKRGEHLSVICHDGSYGYEEGLFEICPSWKDKQNYKWGDDVKGFCTFGEVQRWINKLHNRDKSELKAFKRDM